MDSISINKMQQKLSLIDEFIQAVVRNSIWIGLIIAGIAGRFGADILMNRRISLWYIVGTLLTSLFVGFIAFIWYSSHDPETGKIMVPILTLSSRDVLLTLRMINWSKLIELLTKLPLKK
jgi:phage shock protein PspC (stress-responsive transcriptional regulator)